MRKQNRHTHIYSPLHLRENTQFHKFRQKPIENT